MKAISLYNPYPILAALGEKGNETRSWATYYRGPLALHATKTFPTWAKEKCWLEPFRSVLLKHGYRISFCDWLLGAVVGICELVDIYRITETELIQIHVPISIAKRLPLPSEPELSFGDYTPGRFAWELKNARLITPIPAKGGQRLWNWTAPEGLAI